MMHGLSPIRNDRRKYSLEYSSKLTLTPLTLNYQRRSRKKMVSETRDSRYLAEILKMHISDVLTNMETDIDLFETLLCSYPSRLRAVKNANGRHTDY